MSIKTTSKYGRIKFSLEAVASLATQAASECYGVVGLAKVPFTSDDRYGKKGVYVRLGSSHRIVNLYLYLAYGVRITEVISEVQKKVKYVLETSFGVPFDSINVFVEDVKEI